MKEFKVGDGFIYCPGNRVCLVKITKIGEWNDQKKYKKIEYKRYTYIDNSCTYNDEEYETGKAKIFHDENNEREYVQLDHWFTHKYCIRHIVYCE